MPTASMRLIATVYDVTVSSTALDLEDLGFDPEDIHRADNLLIQVLDGAIREKHDGDVPEVAEGWLHTTAGDGLLPVAGYELVAAVQVIRDGSTDATINAALYEGA